MENRSTYTNRFYHYQHAAIIDAAVLFRLSHLGAFVFEFTLDAVIIKSAVVFAPIRYDKLKAIPLLEVAVPKNLCQTSPFSALGSWENAFSPLDLIFMQ